MQDFGDDEEWDIDEMSVYGPIAPESRHYAHYAIKGFRSLQDFNICLKPGLNVLLGSNGSGKTNFIDFLDLITVLVNQNSGAAVSSAGGVARVFSQESLKRKIPRVTAKIVGLADLKPHAPSIRNNRYFRFEYEVDIRYSKFHTAVYIANEKVKFKSLHSDTSWQDSETTVGSLELHRKSPLSEDEVRWKVGNYLYSNANRNPLRFVHSYRMPAASKKGLSPLDARRLQLNQPPPAAPDESFLSARPAFPALDAVRDTLARGRSFNLNPQQARAPDDISRAPIIGPDGSGLSATIYQMQQAKRAESRPTLARRRFKQDALDTIISWTQIVIPDLHDITATADPHTGKYIVFLHVGDEQDKLKIPLQSMSDGTLKWLTFVALIVAQGSEYTFEEPENFLHPKMQQFLVSLLRDNLPDVGGRFIISTHSETIINQCVPDELIIFSFEGGKTVCKRIDNASAVIKQVNETGFGLGHYYAQNVLY